MASRASGGQRSFVFGETEFRPVTRRLNQLPKEVQAELRKDNLANAKRLAAELSLFSRSVGPFGLGGADVPPQAGLVAEAVYPRSDRLIRVDVGGNKRVGWKYVKQVNGQRQYKPKGGATAGQLLWGSEFGSRPGKGNRFKKPPRKGGYWIGPTVQAWAPDLVKIWRERVATYLSRIGAS